MSKFFRLALCSALVALVVALPALAVEVEGAPASDEVGETDIVTSETQVDDKNIIVNVTLPAASPAPVETPPVESLPEVVEEEIPPSFSYAISAPDEVPPTEDTTALSAVVSALFGTYTPRTQTVTQYLPDGSSVVSQEVISGLAGLDWHWLAGLALFFLCLLSFFKILGGVLKRG